MGRLSVPYDVPAGFQESPSDAERLQGFRSLDLDRAVGAHAIDNNQSLVRLVPAINSQTLIN